MPQKKYSVNAPKVISQDIDGEVVIINLDNGFYYSLDEHASAAWSLITRGLTVGEIAEAVAARLGKPVPEADPALTAFAAQLVAEDLLRPADSPGPAAGGVQAPVWTPTTFGSPVLTKYSDMRDLLLLDPIHEVTDAGWPEKKPGGSKPGQG